MPRDGKTVFLALTADEGEREHAPLTVVERRGQNLRVRTFGVRRAGGTDLRREMCSQSCQFIDAEGRRVSIQQLGDRPRAVVEVVGEHPVNADGIA